MGLLVSDSVCWQWYKQYSIQFLFFIFFIFALFHFICTSLPNTASIVWDLWVLSSLLQTGLICQFTGNPFQKHHQNMKCVQYMTTKLTLTLFCQKYFPPQKQDKSPGESPQADRFVISLSKRQIKKVRAWSTALVWTRRIPSIPD